MGTTIRSRRPGQDAADARAEQEERERIDQLVRDNWDDPTWRAGFHADLVETIWLGFQFENLLQYFTTVEYAGEFERISVEVVEGLEVFWVALGSQIDATTLQAKTWELLPQYVGYHISELEDHIRSGFSKYFDRLVPLATAQMDAAVNSRLLRTLRAAIGPSSDFYHSAAGFDLGFVDTALEEVEDEASGWPEDIGEVALVGRPTMIAGLINAIKEDTTYLPETNEEIRRTGVLGEYRGAKIVKLRNWKDRNKVSYFPGNELLIASTAASKVGIWDNMVTKEWTEEGGFYWHHLSRRECGFAVPHPEFARRLVDSNRAA